MVDDSSSASHKRNQNQISLFIKPYHPKTSSQLKLKENYLQRKQLLSTWSDGYIIQLNLIFRRI